eukprot:scaffold2778_cov48-Cylindrotheca_fusiformis.AAC.1
MSFTILQDIVRQPAVAQSSGKMIPESIKVRLVKTALEELVVSQNDTALDVTVGLQKDNHQKLLLHSNQVLESKVSIELLQTGVLLNAGSVGNDKEVKTARTSNAVKKIVLVIVDLVETIPGNSLIVGNTFEQYFSDVEGRIDATYPKRNISLNLSKYVILLIRSDVEAEVEAIRKVHSNSYQIGYYMSSLQKLAEKERILLSSTPSDNCCREANPALTLSTLNLPLEQWRGWDSGSGV